MISEAKRLLSAVTGLLICAANLNAQGPDPRPGLRAGFIDAASASRHVELIGSRPRPEGFVNAANLGDLLFANSDMAFRGNTLFLGSFHGFQIYDISDPRNPRLQTAFVCPGGQGDLSVHGNLLFMSVEMPNGRIDCAPGGSMSDSVSATRFGGVRIFDISDLNKPKQVAAVQTCRGSHTHTLVSDPEDKENVYIYVSGAMPVRSPSELAGCSGLPPEKDPNTSYFRIEVIQVPLAAPQTARIINTPRVFAATSGAVAGLWQGGTHGPGTQETASTNHCHDITAYPEIGLAAGACSGNGILLDISDPANPVRIAEVSDPNFAYWHSATFSNDASKVLFTDEWGGGMAPRCQATDRKEWGADALFELSADRKLRQTGYYKLPAAQGPTENCVAHNGSLIPVPGRDIMVQAWYQGGMSVFDFTDPANPVEIAYFDRGPYHEKNLLLGGYWSTYWYNGQIYGSEIGRGLDVFTLKPSEQLSENEIEAARLARVAGFNPQTQTRVTWPASFVVARAYVDQLKRVHSGSDAVSRIASDLAAAEKLTGKARATALTQLAARVDGLDGEGRSATLLAQLLKELAAQS
ncbi:MAG: LVIVD repeat-containing protein [Gemmatimonadota bacterium]